MTPNDDQLPEGWSDGAAGYQEHFAGFTEQYADEMLDRLGVGPGDRVLDVAAGTGATSMRAATRGAVVLATDFAPGMVDIAEHRLRAAGFAESTAAVMDGQALEVDAGSFDAAVSMFGLMFFPDPRAGLEGMLRATRPGGRVGTATWELDGFGLRSLIGGALDAAVPELRDRPAPSPTWAPLGTVQGLAALFAESGAGHVEVVEVTRQWTFADPARFFREMPTWSSPVKPLFDMLPPDRLDAGAEAFGDLVADADGLEGGTGVPMTALIGIGVA
jgi:SAM-dependent methyltransferase